MGFLIFIAIVAAIGIALYVKRNAIGQWLSNVFG